MVDERLFLSHIPDTTVDEVADRQIFQYMLSNLGMSQYTSVKQLIVLLDVVILACDILHFVNPTGY